mmetsp:Transcript_1112/g.1862  ORF Transcript_1112/g.1862 Transcript_1112/m.1862 type:complete len:231 (+) Transcript_1112:115-807(+)
MTVCHQHCYGSVKVATVVSTTSPFMITRRLLDRANENIPGTEVLNGFLDFQIVFLPFFNASTPSDDSSAMQTSVKVEGLPVLLALSTIAEAALSEPFFHRLWSFSFPAPRTDSLCGTSQNTWGWLSGFPCSPLPGSASLCSRSAQLPPAAAAAAGKPAAATTSSGVNPGGLITDENLPFIQLALLALIGAIAYMYFSSAAGVLPEVAAEVIQEEAVEELYQQSVQEELGV